MDTTLLKLFWSSSKIGLLAFGGGNTAIPMLEADAVPQWLTRQEFAELVGINFAFPGVSILKLAGMVGLRAGGIPGMMVSIVGLATPGLVLTVLAYGVLGRFRGHAVVDRALTAMQYGAVILLISSALNIFRTASGNGMRASILIGMVLLFGATHFLKLSPVLTILLAVAGGIWIL